MLEVVRGNVPRRLGRFRALALVVAGLLSFGCSRKPSEKGPMAEGVQGAGASHGQGLSSSAASAKGSDGGSSAVEAVVPSSRGDGGDGAGARVGEGASKALELPKDLNVLLLSIDSLRADMPWAGYPRPIAPRLTQLEASAVSYTRAYAISSYTSMSVGGLLASKLPSELKRDGYFFGTYGKDCLFFPEVLQEAKVRTLSAHAHGYFKDSGLKQGFDRWEIVPDLKWNNTTDENVTSPQLEALAEKLLGDPSLSQGRFFAWFHFLDPHDQYVAHPGIGPYGKGLRDRYDAEVTFTDQAIGKLLDFVAQKPYASRTAIVVTADHGEAFGEHKMFFHGFELYEMLVRIPLFFVVPGVPPRRIDEPRSALDLAPTLVEMFGLPPVEGFRGKSLVPELLHPEAPLESRPVPLDLPATSDNARRRALVMGRRKIMAGPEDGYLVLYDLDADPEETKPQTKGEGHGEMVLKYKEFYRTIKDIPPYSCKDEKCLNGGYRKDGGVK